MNESLFKFITGVAGCLSASTKVGISRALKSKQFTIEEVVYKLNGNITTGRKWNDAIPTYIRAMKEDGIIGLVEIESGIYSGIKATYTIRTRSGNHIRATEDHQFLTDEGWKKVSELTINSVLLIDKGKSNKSIIYKPNYHRMGNLKNHPYHHNSFPKEGLVWTHRLIVEADMNGLTLQTFISRIKEDKIEGLKFLDTDVYIVHHKDEDTSNNDLNNLEIQERLEHYKHHAKKSGWKNVQSSIGRDIITSIKFYGMEPTYDLTIKDKNYPNFLANGIVVHNSGKTYLAKSWIDSDPSYGILCSSTGISAVNLNTTTIHSLLGYFNTSTLEDKYIEGSLQRKLRKLQGQYSYIILDEVSMIPAEDLDILCKALDQVNENADTPIGLIVIGDFNQLPPVEGNWAFTGQEWSRFNDNITHLTKIWRQDNIDFINALNLARAGEGKRLIEQFKNLKVDFNLAIDTNFEGTTIFGKNRQVDNFNDIKLAKCNGKMIKSHKYVKGRKLGEWDKIPNILEVKLNSYIMILVNKSNIEKNGFEYSNGDCGYIRDYDRENDIFYCELIRNKQIVQISRTTRYFESKYKPDVYSYAIDFEPYINERHRWVLGEISYHPIRLAYASTVYKVQGLTLDRVQIDVRNHFIGFPNQLYVALSRGRNIEGLRLVCPTEQLMIKRCNVDYLVKKFYKELYIDTLNK